MKRTKPITDREVAAIKRPGRHSLGENLMLQVSLKGARSWIGRVTDHRGRRRDLGLGSCRDVSLKKARLKVRLAREAIDDHKDPKDAINPEPTPTFEAVARVVYAEREKTYSNKKHRAQWISSLETYVFPSIGDIPIDEIASPEVMRVMQPIWLGKEKTARRVLQRVATVVEYAIPLGFREHELPIRSIRNALPRQGRKVRHHAACPVNEAPQVYRNIKASLLGSSHAALRLILLTAARSNEARGAKWGEIDFDARIWTIPAERMKSNREHRVPLGDEAVNLLKQVTRIDGCDLIFPNSRGKPFSDTCISKSFKQFAPGFTVHGWRSTFKDWSATQTDYPDDLSEAALAHVDPNRVRAAYKRDDLLEKRRGLMLDWDQYLLGIRS